MMIDLADMQKRQFTFIFQETLHSQPIAHRLPNHAIPLRLYPDGASNHIVMKDKQLPGKQANRLIEIPLLRVG